MPCSPGCSVTGTLDQLVTVNGSVGIFICGLWLCGGSLNRAKPPGRANRALRAVRGPATRFRRMIPLSSAVKVLRTVDVPPSVPRTTMKRAQLPYVVLLGLAAFIPAASAAPDERLKAAAERAKPALIETLHDMVMIESGSSDVAGLKAMADFTEARLKALGATTERRKTTRGAGADMVIGTFEGTGKRKLMLIAHMDTVYLPGILKTEPYHVDGDLIYGPGIADDKSGIAVILHGLQILKDRGWRDYAKLTVSFNPDEEVGSIGSGEIISELADQHDVVLSCEPTAARHESLRLGASGTATGTLDVTGRASHAGGAPDRGRNALIELAHQLLQTQDVAKSIPGTQLNWTVASAGTVGNQIPERASARADIRLTV